MKPHGTPTLIGLVVLMTGALGQALIESRFDGTWKGRMHELPAVTLTVTTEGGKLEGKVTFFRLRRGSENDPWHVDGEDTVPLLKPTITGNRLSFEVEHHKCDGCTELGPNVKMSVELTGNGEAKLGDVLLVREE